MTAEIFLVIWKSMYDIVYYKQNSRIAEKMLEKIILLNRNNDIIQRSFKEDFIGLHDEELLGRLEDIGGKAEKFVNNIRNDNLYKKLQFEISIDSIQFPKDIDLIKKIQVNDNVASDNLSKLLNKQLGIDEYSVICDIITSRKPKTIHLEKPPNAKEDDKLEDKSSVVQSIGLRSVLRVYKDPDVSLRISEKEIEEKLKGLIQGGADELFVTAKF